jgi:hypothetical protein
MEGQTVKQKYNIRHILHETYIEIATPIGGRISAKSINSDT